MTKKAEAEESTAIVNWEEQMRQQAKDVAKLERPTTNKISFKSGIMSYMDQAMPDNQLDGIILQGIHENVLYLSQYDPDRITPPDCFALSTTGISMVPHPDVPNPVSPQCAGCRMLEFKSARNGKGKACGQRRRLAVIPNLEKAEDIATAEMAVISLPVMSVKNWANYVNRISAQYQRPPWGVLTRVKLVPDPKSQFKVTFDVVHPLGDDLLPHIYGRLEMAESILMTPYDMTVPEEPEPEEKGKKKY